MGKTGTIMANYDFEFIKISIKPDLEKSDALHIRKQYSKISYKMNSSDNVRGSCR